MGKMKIGGLKQSLELCQFNLGAVHSSDEIASQVSKLLLSHRINMEFLTFYPQNKNHHQLTFCVSQDTYSTALEILKKEGSLSKALKIDSREHVGIVTVFPHQSAMMILGLIMASWADQSIPIHGVATSLSAISFVTDYRILEKAINVLQDLFQMPEDHAPIKPEIRFQQSEIVRGD